MGMVSVWEGEKILGVAAVMTAQQHVNYLTPLNCTLKSG